ncbi:hypothetical protein BH23PAT2_BH23PAT2_04330 [soil metagenome]
MISPEKHTPGLGITPGAMPSFEQDPLRVAKELLQRGFRETDGQFNLSSRMDLKDSSVDVVNPVTKKRLFITSESNLESEEKITAVLGDHAILQRAEGNDYPVADIYDVPRGSRPLFNTLSSGPYEKSYMRHLAVKSVRFMDMLYKIDKNAFGIEFKDLALTHNGEDYDSDDTYITVTPPVQAPDAPEKIRLPSGDWRKRPLSKTEHESIMSRLEHQAQKDRANDFATNFVLTQYFRSTEGG